ncbi:hypothetical protein G7066_13155 [Leucobacter coleopterorum]|uniref:Metallo-peptidase family M12B Reprolysin-like n=1 Tax=Leucobacter coleopterorum TaxID=2714933 RepID=A0ABX6JZD5_9MICO|nr:M12 family metallo-peptidase [Leucobacter coleopterorum]QIM19276.1 hypothetical protein G7066_13155 [Leucobacter coleopterorum]
MRKVVNSVAGCALALLLALSVAPANALDPLTPEDGVTAVEDQTQPDAVDGSENADGTKAAENEDAEADATGGQSGDTTPRAEDTDAAAPTNEGDAAPVTEAPETIEVTGTVYVMPDEAAPQNLEQIEAGEEPVIRQGDALVATDQVGLVKLDEANSQGVLESGSAFSGVVQLPEESVAALQDRIDVEGELSSTEVAETAADAAYVAGTSLETTGVGIDAEAAAPAALAAKSHPVDIRYFGGSALPSPTRAQLESLVNTASTYWKEQTGGQISSMPVASYKSLAPSTSRCDVVALWNQAIFDMGYRNANTYLTSGRHLVTFVNAGCGDAYGLALLGTLHSGGVTWIDLGMRGGSNVPVSDAEHAVAHELGHTLGLGHSNARQCTSPRLMLQYPPPRVAQCRDQVVLMRNTATTGASWGWQHRGAAVNQQRSQSLRKRCLASPMAQCSRRFQLRAVWSRLLRSMLGVPRVVFVVCVSRALHPAKRSLLNTAMAQGKTAECHGPTVPGTVVVGSSTAE